MGIDSDGPRPGMCRAVNSVSIGVEVRDVKGHVWVARAAESCE